jgi:REP element-mobilizing transposase RayT
MSRVIDGRDMFLDDRDRCHFLSLLERYLPECGCLCYAWALMRNHFHLLLQPLGDELCVVMGRLNTAFAQYFNLRYARCGYVYQNRYKSVVTQGLAHLHELIRYIHLNPIRAGVVENLDALAGFAWTGHRAMLGLCEVPWQATAKALQHFGPSDDAARRAYLDFLAEGLEKELSGWRFDECYGTDGEEMLKDDRVIGDAAFVQAAIERVEKIKLLRSKSRNSRPSLEQIFQTCCARAGISVTVALSRGRQDVRSLTRGRFCFEASWVHGYTVREIGHFLRMTPGCVSRRARASSVTCTH